MKASLSGGELRVYSCYWALGNAEIHVRIAAVREDAGQDASGDRKLEPDRSELAQTELEPGAQQQREVVLSRAHHSDAAAEVREARQSQRPHRSEPETIGDRRADFRSPNGRARSSGRAGRACNGSGEITLELAATSQAFAPRRATATGVAA